MPNETSLKLVRPGAVRSGDKGSGPSLSGTQDQYHEYRGHFLESLKPKIDLKNGITEADVKHGKRQNMVATVVTESLT